MAALKQRTKPNVCIGCHSEQAAKDRTSRMLLLLLLLQSPARRLREREREREREEAVNRKIDRIHSAKPAAAALPAILLRSGLHVWRRCM
jgi:hypothetical protein